MNDLPFKITTLLTSTVVAGEALALLVGMHLLSEGDNSWISVKNDLFLALDIVAGLGLVYLALAHRGTAWPYALCFLVSLALLTHGYREWEYLARASNPFCANAPLFVVNNLKLAGLLAVAASARISSTLSVGAWAVGSGIAHSRPHCHCVSDML
jgi:hypothetical protein